MALVFFVIFFAYFRITVGQCNHLEFGFGTFLYRLKYVAALELFKTLFFTISSDSIINLFKTRILTCPVFFCVCT